MARPANRKALTGRAGRVSEATKEALKEQTGGMEQAPRRRTD